MGYGRVMMTTQTPPMMTTSLARALINLSSLSASREPMVYGWSSKQQQGGERGALVRGLGLARHVY